MILIRMNVWNVILNVKHVQLLVVLNVEEIEALRFVFVLMVISMMKLMIYVKHALKNVLHVINQVV